MPVLARLNPTASAAAVRILMVSPSPVWRTNPRIGTLQRPCQRAGRRFLRLKKAPALGAFEMPWNGGGASWRGPERSVRPADRQNEARVVVVEQLVGRPAVVAVVGVDRDGEVFEELALEAGFELRALPAQIAQAGEVTKADVDRRLRTIVG